MCRRPYINLILLIESNKGPDISKIHSGHVVLNRNLVYNFHIRGLFVRRYLAQVLSGVGISPQTKAKGLREDVQAWEAGAVRGKSPITRQKAKAGKKTSGIERSTSKIVVWYYFSKDCLNYFLTQCIKSTFI